MKGSSSSNVIKERPILIKIAGEEDLPVIPVILEAPKKAFVVYDQPNESIVPIKVTMNTKVKFRKLTERMKVEKKCN